MKYLEKSFFQQIFSSLFSKTLSRQVFLLDFLWIDIMIAPRPLFVNTILKFYFYLFAFIYYFNKLSEIFDFYFKFTQYVFLYCKPNNYSS